MNCSARLLTTLTLSFFFTASFSQNLSNKGKEFWVGYGHHQFFEETGGQFNIQDMVLYLSADQPATVTVSINGTSYSNTYSIGANSVIATTPIPKAGTNDARLWNPLNSEAVFNKGIRILSDVPIVAYAHIYGSASSGATMLMPVETWGHSYISVNSEQTYAANCFSWLYVVAKENNTKVRITPRVNTRGGRAANVPFDVVLNRGQIYQVLGAIQSGTVGYQLTGTTVVSIANDDGVCHPIAVFSGSSRTGNPAATCTGGGGDNDMQQLFPSQAWGKRYLTAPTSRSSNAALPQTNSYKIAVKDPTTVVRRNGTVLTGLINNTYYRYESNTADYIESDKPIMVAQFMTGGNCMGGTGTNVGDPEMIYISPIEQGIKKIGFYRNTLQNITVNYLTLIIPTTGLASLTIDGTFTLTHTYAHPNLPGYTVVVRRWTAAQAQCLVQSDSAFTAVTYGLGSVESYGYNAGTLINNLNVIGTIRNTLDATSTNSHPYTCRNTPAEISMLIAYKPTNMNWRLSQVAALSPNADVNVANPTPVDSVRNNGTWYYRYTLPGTYLFTDTGTFVIPVRNTHTSADNCNNSDDVSFTLTVKMNPTADFTINHTGCVLDPVQFTSPSSTGNGYTVNTWSWVFPDASTSPFPNPVRTFTSTGDQSIYLKVITTEGCVGDTMRTVKIYDKPTAAFDVSASSICETGNISFSDQSVFGGTGPITTWYWNYGSGPAAHLTNGNTHSVSYPNYGTYTVKHLVKVSDACVSDTVTRVINVYAKPRLSISYPAGCLPSDGIVQFNNATAVPDGQTLSHNWIFGDANANASNPNTSTQQSPSHTYSANTYTINYSVGTPNGCTKDTSFTTTFNVRAQLLYPATQPSVCESVKGTVSVADATVTNGVNGTGIYKGQGTDASGNFRPSLAGPGVHTIWYVFTSAGGCKDSVSTSIKVHPKPVANFTVDGDICLDEAAAFTDASTIGTGNIISWQWNFGDGHTATYANGNNFSRPYAGFNNYTVKLVTLSDSACVSDTVSKIVKVHPLPVPDFTLPASVCMPGGELIVRSGTTLADGGTWTEIYDWGDGSIGPGPSHVYAAPGNYIVGLTCTSQFGCVADTFKTFSAFYDKPLAKFSVAPDTLCQGSDNVFTNLSTAPNSTVQSWNWNFGDNTVSTQSNPVKKYTQPGNYTVTLTVKNAAGCTSDPFTDKVIVYLQPVIDAGPSFVVPQGTQVRFNPTANDSTVLSFMWTPAGSLSNMSVLRPTIIATHNQLYTLTAIGQGNCSATDTLSVKILKPVKVPNSFSPNGDGIYDTWLIPNLADYPGATVEVFNRYGQQVYRSNGYSTPWNGTYKGSALPFATYYYVITLKNGFAPVTGSVTIVK